MNKRFKSSSVTITAALALTFAVRGALADPIVSYTGVTYTQDFNSLATYDPSSETWGINLAPPVDLSIPMVIPPQINNYVNPLAVPLQPVYTPVDLTGPSDDADPTDGIPASIATLSNMTGWYAINDLGNSSPLKYNVTDGSSNTAALNAYFDPTVQSSGNNLSLGILAGSASGNVHFGVKLVNNSGQGLNAISVSFLGELFHEDLNAAILSFGYLVDNSTNNSTIPTVGTTAVGALNLSGFATGSSGAVTVSASGTTSQLLSVTNFPLTTTWAPGGTLWLTWNMASGGGGQGLGIDDLTFSASELASFGTITWNRGGDGNWNFIDANWTGSSTTFANNFNVLFGNATANSHITIDPAGVSVQTSATITNNQTTSYFFAGGSINGASASLNINGNGVVVLQSPNGYGVATNINSGTLVVDQDNELGAATAALNLNGGTLQLAGMLGSGNRTLGVTSTSGGMINLNGFNATFGTSTSHLPIIHGQLEVTGAGNLDLGIQPGFGANSTISGLAAGSLMIDAGSTVTITGNSRTNAINMYAGGVINGILSLNTTSLGSRFNIDSPGQSGPVDLNGTSKITGTGEIQVVHGSGWTAVEIGSTNFYGYTFDTNGVVISNTSATYAGEIDVNIHLNPLADSDPADHPYTRLNVATANFSTTGISLPNATTSSFGFVIGGTKIGTQGHGPGFSNLIIKGVIFGHSDVSIGNDYKNGGSGDTTFMAQNTYDGATLINGGGALVIGINDALPPTTDVVFNSFSGDSAGFVDLDGHNQHVQSIEVALGGNTPESNAIYNSGLTNATLFVTGSVNTFYPYNGELNDGGTGSDGVTRSNTLALVKSGQATLILGQFSALGHTSSSSYSGGTTVMAGSLQVSFDGAMGAPSGSLTLDGGTLSVQNPAFIGLNVSADETMSSFTSTRPFAVTANGGTIDTPSFNYTLQFNSTLVANQVEAATFTNNNGFAWGGPLNLTGAPGSSVAFNSGTGTVSVASGASIIVGNIVALTLGGDGDPATDSIDNTKHLSITNNGSLQFTGGNKTIGAVSGNGSVAQLGAGTTTLNGNAYTATGSIAVSGGGGGTLAFGNTSAPRQTAGVLLTASSVSVASSNTLDLGNHDLLIHSGSTAGLEAQVGAAYDFDLFDQAGISSSTAGVSGGLTTLGINSADDYNSFGTSPGVFDGSPVVSGDTLIKYTYAGDLNLDGVVDDNDLFQFLGTYLGTQVGDYAEGDLNYDGVVDDNDLFIFLANYLNPPTQTLGELDGSLADTTGVSPAFSLALGGSSPVPEPASLAVLGLGAAALMRRKKSRSC